MYFYWLSFSVKFVSFSFLLESFLPSCSGFHEGLAVSARCGNNSMSHFRSRQLVSWLFVQKRRIVRGLSTKCPILNIWVISCLKTLFWVRIESANRIRGQIRDPKQSPCFKAVLLGQSLRFPFCFYRHNLCLSWQKSIDKTFAKWVSFILAESLGRIKQVCSRLSMMLCQEWTHIWAQCLFCLGDHFECRFEVVALFLENSFIIC